MFVVAIINTNTPKSLVESRFRTHDATYLQEHYEAFSDRLAGIGRRGDEMRYPVVIHKDLNSDYGVTAPDLPGCFSAGETMDEALAYMVEAIECHLEGLMLDGEPLPTPTGIERHQSDPLYSGGIWALVDVDLTKLSGKARRVNITIPERVLSLIDDYALRQGETRSGLITQAALEFIAGQAQPA